MKLTILLTFLLCSLWINNIFSSDSSERADSESDSAPIESVTLAETLDLHDWAHPTYGNLVTSDSAHNDALLAVEHSDARIFEKHGRELEMVLEQALHNSVVPIDTLEYGSYWSDEAGNLTAMDPQEEWAKSVEVVADAATGTVYDFNPDILGQGVLHNEAEFYRLFRQGIARLESPSPPAVLPNFGGVATIIDCGHAFCSMCLDAILDRDKHCPICKSELSSELRRPAMSS